MPQIRGVKGEAVVSYCEPLTTKEMGYPRLSQRVNNMKISDKNYSSLITDRRDIKFQRMLKMYCHFMMITCSFILFTLNEGFML